MAKLELISSMFKDTLEPPPVSQYIIYVCIYLKISPLSSFIFLTLHILKFSLVYYVMGLNLFFESDQIYLRYIVMSLIADVVLLSA